MVYLLQTHFGADGRDEAEAMLERHSGDQDNPRILQAFNYPVTNWLDFFCFTAFMDRDGKYQLASLAESSFDPLARTTQFMLAEEAYHLQTGENGVGRIVKRTGRADAAQGKDPRKVGAIPLDIIQKYINFWFTGSMDLFGGEDSHQRRRGVRDGPEGPLPRERRHLQGPEGPATPTTRSRCRPRTARSRSRTSRCAAR
jgi:benzoyl-CoA 2,3-dioxygenase component B